MKILLIKNKRVIASYKRRKTTAHALKLLGYDKGSIEATINQIRDNEITEIQV